MKHIIVGTAGHIDHGKTSLIKALTGRNTDRLEEEQRRGITIDLGFTYFDLPSQRRVGIIDVPGHEKFVSNMVVGVAGMDLVLLVIAADEGIMPQTREHIDILEQFEVSKSIIVMNKCDLVEEEWIQLVEEEIRDELKDSSFQEAPIARVSANTGQGLHELVQMIDGMMEAIPGRDIAAIPRLPIDRVFSLSGFGTIVTGTLISGQINKNDQLAIFPIEKECKIRSIQVHGKEQETCYAGQRVAINLVNIKKDEIRRGCVIAPKESMKKTMMLDVRLNVGKSFPRVIGNRTRLRLITGASEVLCRLILLDKEDTASGEDCLAQLRLEEEIALRKGDRFIVRLYSPMETVGGGVILDANPTKKKRFDQAAIEKLLAKEEGSAGDTMELLINENSEFTISMAEISKLTGLSSEEVKAAVKELLEQNKIRKFELQKDLYFWHKEFEAKVIMELLENLETFHQNNPYKQGMNKSEVRMKYLPKMKQNLFDLFIQNMMDENTLKRENEFIFRSDFKIEKTGEFNNAETIIKQKLQNAGYHFIKFTEIEFGSCTDIADDILAYLVNCGEVVKITQDYYTTPELAGKATGIVKDILQNNGLVTMAELRDQLDTSRKNIKLLLEYLDTNRITRRNGPESERIAYDSLHDWKRWNKEEGRK